MAIFLQFDVDDTSPLILYSPFGDTFSTPDLSAGWNPYFDDSGFASSPGETGNGNSFHITSLNGASLTVQWHGTGIQLLGNATGATFTIVLDGETASTRGSDTGSANNILAGYQNLADTSHIISLIANTSASQQSPDSSMIVFDKAIITFNSTNPLNTRTSALNDSEIAFLGQWTFQNASSQAFHQSTTLGDRAQTQFTGTAFLLKGMTSPQSGQYSVTLDNATSTFSAQSSFTNHDTLLYYATDLNPDITHTVEITNSGGRTLVVNVAGFTVLSTGSIPFPNPSSTSIPLVVSSTTEPSFSKGTVAAFALAGILAFVLFSGLLYFFIIYRPRRRRRHFQAPRLPEPSKGEEVGAVLDIGPHAIGAVSIHQSNRSGSLRSSPKSGFARWKSEVEGHSRVSGLGIKFRHSGSTGNHTAKDSAGSHSRNPSRDNPPLSTRSSIFTSSSMKRSIQRAKKKGKGKRSPTDSSESPSFTLDLPFKPSLKHEDDESLHGSELFTLSYVTAPVDNPGDRSLAPPSYVASISTPESNSNSDRSSQIYPIHPSVPRSVSTQSAFPIQSSRPHARDSSQGYLHFTAANVGSSGNDRYHENVDALRITPPQTFLDREDGRSVAELSDQSSVFSSALSRVALRGLSPRTVDFRPTSRPFPPPRIVTVENHPVPESIHRPQSLVLIESDNRAGDDILLNIPEPSPFRVNFEDNLPSSQSTESETVMYSQDVSSLTAEHSHPSSIRPQRARLGQGASRHSLRIQPLPHIQVDNGEAMTSFLDFTVSSDISLRTQSHISIDRASTTPNLDKLKSRWSASTSLSIANQGSTESGSSTSAQMHLHEVHPVPLLPAFYSGAQRRSGISSTSHLSDLHVHPITDNLESPTESVPMSVSDMQFRNSRESDDNRALPSQRTSSFSHLPSHPPLPGADLPHPSPSLLVQRVLGISPSSGAFGRHARSPSENPSTTPVPPQRPDYSYDTRDDGNAMNFRPKGR